MWTVPTNSWRLWDRFDRIEIEVGPRERSADAGAGSVRELDELLRRTDQEPEARRVVQGVHDRLRGLPVGCLDDIASASALRRDLRAAARAGGLTLRRVAQRSVAFIGDPGEDSALGPDTTTKHLYTVCVLDDTGTPVAGAKLTLDVEGDKHEKTTGGSGKVTVEKPDPGTATVTLTNVEDLREKLWPQWSKPAADKAPPGDQLIAAVVTQPIAAFKAPSDWQVTLVLTRPPIWRVRMVGMLFDADKCFLIPQALDGIKSVVAMHQAHPAAKVVIVGHEGGDEVQGSVDLALGRAKILADYLTSKPDGWMTWFGSDKSDRERWGAREVQLMLSALAGAGGKPLYDGSSPGVIDDKTTAALKAFQLANGLTADGKPSSDTRKALVSRYMAIEDTSLAAGVEPVSHGCTGHEDDTITQDGLQPDDRRLEVLFFDTDIKPPPSGDTSDGGSPEYPAWRARLVQTVDFENHGIHVQIVDMAKQPMPLATVHLDGPAPQDTTADEHGFVSFWGLVAGEYEVHGTSRTGIPLPEVKLTYPTAKTTLGARVLPSQAKGPQGGPPPPSERAEPSADGPPAPAPQGAT
jgi:outer membrane protein OmpA-like peptidoglycan-associated protein